MSELTNVAVSRGYLVCPDLCPACLSGGPFKLHSVTSDSKFGGYFFFFITWKSLTVQFKFCNACARKERWLGRGLAALSFLGLLVGVVISIWFDIDKQVTGFLCVALCAPAIILPAYMVSPVRISRHDDHLVEFSFKSFVYGQAFKTLNNGHILGDRSDLTNPTDRPDLLDQE
jgi:hypothetical protein